MIDLIRHAPEWVISHPWWTALIAIVGLAAFASLILLNPNGRQLRNLWRNG